MSAYIQRATIEDLGRVYELICVLKESILDKDAFSAIYTNGLQNSSTHYLVAQIDDLVVGFLSLSISDQLHHAGKIAEIVEFVVDPDYRSINIGSALFDKSADVARQEECLQLELCTNMLRTRAHQFYKNKGMNNFHYRFSMALDGKEIKENRIGVC